MSFMEVMDLLLIFVFNGDPPIQDDPELFNVNIKDRADEFVQAMFARAQAYRTSDILVTFGSDFQYMNANINFKNMDKLMAYINSHPYGINMFYSTPSIYVKAVNQKKLTWEVKTDDFFPYADRPHAYWTGYFTSRPALKGYVRTRTNIYHSISQTFTASALTSDQIDYNLQYKRIDRMADVLGVAQHHDAVSGTEKQHVADDYAERLDLGTEEAFKTLTDVVDVLISKKKGVHIPFEHCPYLNMSICSATNILVQNQVVPIIVNNPLAWEREEWIRLPVPINTVKVFNSNEKLLPFQIYNNTDIQGLYTIVFPVKLPPLGFTTVFLTSSSQSISSVLANDTVIENQHLKVTFDPNTNLLASIENKDTKKKLTVKQEFFWYNASTGNNKDSDQASGAYIFRPNSSNPFPVTTSKPQIQVVTGSLVQEVRQTFNDWVYQVFRLYNNSLVVEVEQTVGPIPIQDDLGKEVITRFSTDLLTQLYWFTDANGLEMQQRKYNYRPTWKLEVNEPVAGNYYPMNTAAYIKDDAKKLQFSVLTDRSRSAGSLSEGQLEMMLHRRLLVDDRRGVGEPLNETEPIRTKGILVVDENSKSLRHVRIHTQYLNSPSLLLFSSAKSIADWKTNYNTDFKPMKNSLPPNVRLETLKTRLNGEVLLRLAHLFAVNEDSEYSSPVKIDLRDLFVGLDPLIVTEMTMTANRPLKDLHRLNWITEDSSILKSKEERSKVSEDPFIVLLNPMEIKTFIVRFQNTGKKMVF